MERRTAATLLATLLVLAAAGLVAYDLGHLEYPGEGQHDRALVTFIDNDTELVTVETRVADTRAQRIQGLSGVESEADAYMLFVHDREGTYTYVMRDMHVPLDIIFVAANGEVTTIHNAPVPPDDAEELTPYRGEGQWVVEVPQGFAAEHDIEPGVRVDIEYLD